MRAFGRQPLAGRARVVVIDVCCGCKCAFVVVSVLYKKILPVVPVLE
jgi:hypothetical protein